MAFVKVCYFDYHYDLEARFFLGEAITSLVSLLALGFIK